MNCRIRAYIRQTLKSLDSGLEEESEAPKLLFVFVKNTILTHFTTFCGLKKSKGCPRICHFQDVIYQITKVVAYEELMRPSVTFTHSNTKRYVGEGRAKD